jgi:hypothetical protein
VLTLREAISLANGDLALSSLTNRERSQVSGLLANPGLDTIDFQIPEDDGGYNPLTGTWTITARSELPWVRDSATIDGTTQLGYAGHPVIELNGALAGSVLGGLTFTASNNTLRGLVIDSFRNVGVDVFGGGGNNLFEFNYIGTDVSGTAPQPNAGTGIFIRDASSNTIAHSVISGNIGPASTLSP